MQRKIKVAAFISSLILLGFFREYLFVSMNAQLYYKYHNESNPHPFFIEKYLSVFSYYGLYIAKWVLTPGMAFIFWRLQKSFLFFLFSDAQVVKWLTLLYFLFVGLAGVFLVLGWLLNNIENGYVFSRLFMGLLQSAVPCMVLIPIAYLRKNNSLFQ